jgi:exosortase/archaeosortase family protein
MKPINSILNLGPALSNKRIVHFFINLFILFSIWFVVYALILRPPRVIDRPLTNFITSTVTSCINILSPSTVPVSWIDLPVEGRAHITQNGQKVFGVYDVCNGIDLMFIYVGIIVLLPYSLKRKIIFSIGGVVVIIIANIIRVTALYFINVYQHSAFDFSHHYLFTILMYILIFYGWLLFIKKGKTDEKSS